PAVQVPRRPRSDGGAPTPATPSRRALVLARRYPRCVGDFAPPRPDAAGEAGSVGFGNSAGRSRDEGGRQVSPVPGAPRCAVAVFADPGRTDLPGPYGRPARSLRAFRRWTRCEKLACGAPEHGLRPHGLRFVLWIAPADARLVSGRWPGSTRWDWLPP